MSPERERAMESRRRRKRGAAKGAWANSEGDRGKRVEERRSGKDREREKRFNRH
jgi:hypothetical protein